jgi:hypothetical protein
MTMVKLNVHTAPQHERNTLLLALLTIALMFLERLNRPALFTHKITVTSVIQCAKSLFWYRIRNNTT